ncbi:MAG TPA: HD-GYP domain-containing protein [Clostridiaceae bacterium]
MRIVPINSAKEGSFLGKTLFDDDGRVLLREGVKLTNILITKITHHKINTIYIKDEYSSIEIEDIIKPQLRQKAIKSVKDTFLSFNKPQGLKGSSYVAKQAFNEAKERDIQFHKMSEVALELMEELTTKKALLIDLVDIKSMDNYTYQHCVNVAVLSLIIGLHLKFSKDELYELCIGAILHDIGKVFIPKELINKPGKLTDEEFTEMKSHTFRGYDYMKNSPEISAPARIIALQHHERYDGRGYPEGRRGTEINKLAKVVAIADVYDALTSDRPYRSAMCPSEALELIMGGGETQFDFKMVQVFSSIVVPFSVGTLVKLNNNIIGVVLENNLGFPLRPILKMVESAKVINLFTELDMVIIGIVYNLD